MRRAELTGFIANSRAVQRGLRRGLLAGVGLVVALLLAGAGSLVGALFAATVLIGGVGFWITAGHLADFERQLHALGPLMRSTTQPTHPDGDRRAPLPAPPSAKAWAGDPERGPRPRAVLEPWREHAPAVTHAPAQRPVISSARGA